MSRPIYQIAPIDEGQQTGVGILLPMNKAAHANNTNLNSIVGQSTAVGQNYDSGSSGGSSVFAISYSTEEQAISNLKNLLATSRGERFMQPLFGTKIREAVFQPNTVNLEVFLNETISDSIDKWLPYINLQGVDIIRDIDNYSFAIRVNFSVTEIGANRTIIVLANEDTIEVTSDESQITTDTLVQVDTLNTSFASGGY